MEKIEKTRSRHKVKEADPQLFLKANKKESIEINSNKITKKKLRFKESNRHFGNDITGSIKNQVQINRFRAPHKKCSSLSVKVRQNFNLNFIYKGSYRRIKRSTYYR